ncbi:hypothetical protein [Nocardioides bruguierae]|uniref:Uncharacterized protein n=1 Tax=Nocardioides bruguierae TaxID=2945102 RepID=A0A9X2DBB7_9ACTN|nr:hypothetical protein [Nocardioides bruguierae]MCM0622845.1 hypothetical protein [Nocardioides bruguierae]
MPRRNRRTRRNRPVTQTPTYRDTRSLDQVAADLVKAGRAPVTILDRPFLGRPRTEQAEC